MGSGLPLSKNMSYLAKEFLNGFSAKAAKMYVAPLVLTPEDVVLNLIPLESASQDSPAASAPDVSASNDSKPTLYGERDVSFRYHESPAALVFLIIIQRGLNPQNTKGPSAEPLPV